MLNEGRLRLGAFGSVLALLLVLHWRRPLRGAGRGQRRQATDLSPKVATRALPPRA